MEADTEIALAKIFAALWDTMADSNGLDPQEIQDLIDSSGLASWTELTAEEAEFNAEFTDDNSEEGEPILKLTSEGKTVYLMGSREA